jgi:hypothetical protein
VSIPLGDRAQGMGRMIASGLFAHSALGHYESHTPKRSESTGSTPIKADIAFAAIRNR